LGIANSLKIQASKHKKMINDCFYDAFKIKILTEGQKFSY